MNSQILNGYDTYVIFGVRTMGQKAHKRLSSEGFSVKYFTDNDESTWNTEVCGVSVTPPSMLSQIVSEQNALVIIAAGLSMYAVAAQLEQLNIPYVFYSMAVFVEISSLCNQKCTFCPYEYIERKKGNLDWELAKSFLYDITSEKSNVLFPAIYPHIMGEPLLCKYFFDFLDLCKKLKLYVVVVTNFALMDEKMQERLLTNYDNIDIILSLQGPTERVFPWRKEPKLTYKQWIDRMFQIIDSKFKYGFRGQIQISTLWAERANKYLTQSDEQLHLFEWFTSMEEFKNWKQEFGQRCLELADDIKRKYPENFEKMKNEEPQQPLEFFYSKFCVVTELDKWVQSEDPIQFEFLPNVHIYSKTFGIWGAERYFKSLIPEDKYLYWEENLISYPGQCRVFGVGVLSSGQIVPCPVDNEGDYVVADLRQGEMYTDFDAQNKWRMVRDNLSISEHCRRCIGKAFVFNKTPLQNKSSQEITHFGSRWHPENIDENGEKWRASCETSSVFVFSRIEADFLSVELKSIQNKMQHTFIKILSYDDESKLFTERYTFSELLKPGERKAFKFSYKFDIGKFYRIDFITATQRENDVDCGVAVYSASLKIFERNGHYHDASKADEN